MVKLTIYLPARKCGSRTLFENLALSNQPSTFSPNQRCDAWLILGWIGMAPVSLQGCTSLNPTPIWDEWDTRGRGSRREIGTSANRDIGNWLPGSPTSPLLARWGEIPGDLVDSRNCIIRVHQRKSAIRFSRTHAFHPPSYRGRRVADARFHSPSGRIRARAARRDRHRGRPDPRWLRAATQVPLSDRRMGRRSGGLCAFSLQLLHLARAAGAVPGRSVCPSGDAQQGRRQSVVAAAGADRAGRNLLWPALDGAGVELARAQVL